MHIPSRRTANRQNFDPGPDRLSMLITQRSNVEPKGFN